MIGMFLKLFDSSGVGQEVSFIIPLDIPLEAAALIIGDGILPFLVEKYDVEHTKDICSRMITGNYDYTLGKDFLADVIKASHVSNIKGTYEKKSEITEDEGKEITNFFKSELTEVDDWDVDFMRSEEQPSEKGKEVNQSTFPCPLCPTHFGSRLTLNKHTKRVHGEKDYICSICNKGFTNQAYLTSHWKHKHKVALTREGKLLKFSDLGNTHLIEDSFKSDSSEIKSKNNDIIVRDLNSPEGELTGEDTSNPLSSTTTATSKQYRCEICSSVIKTWPNFLYHKQSVHGEKNFKCSICKKAFTTPYKVKLHLRHKHKIETIRKSESSMEKEDSCNSYVLEESPDQDSREQISENEITITQKISSQEEPALLSGELTGENPGEDSSALASPSTEAMSTSYECQMCSAPLKTMRALKKHIENVHGEKNRFCSICNKGFTSQYYVTCHMRQVHKIEPTAKAEKSKKKELNVISKEYSRPSYTCDINCGQVFSSRLRIQRHQRSVHREFFCTLCAKAYLTSHTCHRPHKCEVCGRGFNCSWNLKKHLLIHKGEKPHVCESCGKAFTQISVLQKHQIIHKTRRILACDQCDATFIDEYAFENHKVLHTGEVSHVCEVCNKTFVSKATLRQHRKLHSKVQFECEVCKKSFHHSHRLNEHMIVHSGVRSHVCEICSTAFFLRRGLLRHLQKVHGETGSVCSICKTTFQSRIHLKRHMLSHES